MKPFIQPEERPCVLARIVSNITRLPDEDIVGTAFTKEASKDSKEKDDDTGKESKDKDSKDSKEKESKEFDKGKEMLEHHEVRPDIVTSFLGYV
jgi:hypothetical protein